MDPMALHSLLSRLEASNKKSSRLERRVRIGSHLVLQNVATKEQVHLQIVKDKNTDPMMKDLLYTSVLGCELLGLRRGEVVVVKTSNGVAKWKIITINNEG
ncbi:GreA/GreB family elongation factor [Psychrosphaera sp. B3R10]|uniref:GreA/GreB family elongation factor n=2 Tax=unclassified Psychrosphaera TaxID=2641570 RepID=UPI002090BF42|nr:GreA/GreB family elongation factor [Psychrosphaera sp. B3R10]